MRLLVCGGRHFDDAAMVEVALTALHAAVPIEVLIHGGLPKVGAPLECWARRNQVHVVRYPANFSLGKRGDFVRDDFMLEDSRADAVLALPGGRRTAELRDRAARCGLPVIDAAGSANEANALALKSSTSQKVASSLLIDRLPARNGSGFTCTERARSVAVRNRCRHS